MIAYIEGNITLKTPTHVILQSGGMGFMVHISLNTFSKIQSLDFCRLHTYLHITGGAQSPINVSLFGFFEEEERAMFADLLNISGIGAATVRMVLSALSPNDLRNTILLDDAPALERIKGIGPKTARRIMLEMKDKVARVSSKTDSFTSHNKIREEALSALVMLGFSKPAAEQGVSKIVSLNPSVTLEEIIKQVLKTL